MGTERMGRVRKVEERKGKVGRGDERMKVRMGTKE
jgi:hypothetical protein